MLGRLLRLIWGDDVERTLRPILIVGFAGSLAGSAAWTFIGIWAVDELDASSAQLGVYFVIAAALSATTGYGGRLPLGPSRPATGDPVRLDGGLARAVDLGARRRLHGRDSAAPARVAVRADCDGRDAGARCRRDPARAARARLRLPSGLEQPRRHAWAACRRRAAAHR